VNIENTFLPPHPTVPLVFFSHSITKICRPMHLLIKILIVLVYKHGTMVDKFKFE